MTENKGLDENDPNLLNTKISGIRPPTSFKRPIASINNNSKVPKLLGSANDNISKKAEDSILRRQTFIIPNKPEPKPARTVPLVPVTARISRPITKPASNASIASKNNTAVNRTDIKARPKWDLRGRLEDLEKAMQESAQKSQEQIAGLENERTTLKEEIQSYIKRVEEMEQIKSELNNEIKLKEESLKDYEYKYNQITKEHEKCVHEITEAKELIKVHKDKIDVQTKSIEDINLKYSTLKNQYNEQTQNLSETVKKMQELSEKHDICQAELRKEAKDLEELVKEYNCLKETYSHKIEDFDSLLYRYDSLLAEKNKLIDAMDNDQKRLVDMIGEVDCLRTNCTSKTTTIYSLEKEIEHFKNSQSRLTLEVKMSNEEIERLNKELSLYQYQVAECDVERRLMHHRIMELRGTIRVCCRVRPALPNEATASQYSMEYRFNDSTMVISSSIHRETVTGNKAESNKYEFSFDRLFGPTSTQKEVFDEIDPLVQSALDGYSVCIFAFGQTGSGKTYTMEGDITCPTNAGMIQRAVNKIFDSMVPMQRKGWEYNVEASFLEIYNETIRDLLVSDSSKSLSRKLEIKLQNAPSRSEKNQKNNVCDVNIPNLTTINVKNASEVQNLLITANQNRTVAATKCNEFSSRSHSVFRLKLSGTNDILSQKSEAMINLVDLAGSERLNVSCAEGDRLKEAQSINKSLSCLRNVITSLSKKEQHVPFRDSKLTHLLQSSLGGNCKTLMFANISPIEDHFSESLCSLRFATTVNKCYIGTATQKKTFTH